MTSSMETPGVSIAHAADPAVGVAEVLVRAIFGRPMVPWGHSRTDRQPTPRARSRRWPENCRWTHRPTNALGGQCAATV